MDLRDYQIDVIGALKASMRRVKRQVLQLPTGAGKTFVARKLAAAALEKRDQRIWFSAHRTEIVDQASRHFTEEGIEHSFFRSGTEHDFDARLQCISIQTLYARLKKGAPVPPPPDWWFIDEAHHLASDQWMSCFAYAGNNWVTGLSATPYRSDGSGLSAFQEVVVGPSPRDLVERGVLMNPEIWCPPDRDDKLAGDPVETYLERARGARGVFFCANIAHSMDCAQRLQEAGVHARHVDQDTHRDERRAILEAFMTGEVQVVCNVEVLTEGYDLPALEAISLARRTQSESLFVQMVGRVLRSAPGKERALVFDHGGNALRLGHPLAHRQADITGRKKRAMAELDPVDRVKICKECLTLMPGNAKECPGCGTRNVPPLPKVNRRKKLERWDGRVNTNVNDRIHDYERLERQGIEEQRKGWWSSYRYRNKYGCMPHEDQEMWYALSFAQRAAYWKVRKKKRV